MRYSKPTVPTSDSNVIPFPRKPYSQRPIAVTAPPQYSGATVNHPDPKPASRLHQPRQADATQTTPNQVHQQRALLTIAFKRKPDSPDKADEVAAWTVCQILRRAGEGEASKTWLPTLVRKNLDLMCAYHHPVGLILRDWLDGNRRFLPPNFLTLVKYSTCSEEAE